MATEVVIYMELHYFSDLSRECSVIKSKKDTQICDTFGWFIQFNSLF
jgi:hypothetical protein